MWPAPAVDTPRFALAVLGATLAGFGMSSLFGAEPVWVALAGAATLGVKALTAGRTGPWALVRGADPLFCVFVLALAVVVEAVTTNGLGAAMAAVVPVEATLPGLLGLAGVAAVLANVVNNIPATLVLLTVLGDAPLTDAARPGLVLAVLIGVNVGPNLTYVGSLATLLWRRVLVGPGRRRRCGSSPDSGCSPSRWACLPPSSRCGRACNSRDEQIAGPHPLVASKTPPRTLQIMVVYGRLSTDGDTPDEHCPKPVSGTGRVADTCRTFPRRSGA